MKTLLIVCSVFLLSSCTSKEKLKLVLDSYKGYDQSYVIQNFGQPKKIFDNNGTKILEYQFSEQSFNLSQNNINTRPGYLRSSNGVNSNNINFGFGTTQGYYSSSECMLTFTTDSRNIVRDWHYQGSLCTRYATRENVNHQYSYDLSQATDKSYGFQLAENRKGLKVKEIYPESSAYKLGLRKDDLLTKINNLDLIDLPVEAAYQELNSKTQSKLTVSSKSGESTLVVKKSDIPRSHSYKKSTRKFLGI